MSTLLIRCAKVVCLDEDDTIFEPGYIVIENGRITQIGQDPGDLRATETVDLGNRLIMPGLVNAHTHTPMSLFRGLVEGNTLFTFDGWFSTIRVVEEVMTPDMVPPAVAVSCAEMIRTGTTTFADQYFWMNEIVPTVEQSGLRAALAYGIVELGDERARTRELNAAADFLTSLADHPRLGGWVGPHAFFVDNSEAIIPLEIELAQEFDTGLHIHLSTSGEEDRYCQEKYGCSAVVKMAELGILDLPIIAAHCLTIPKKDFRRLTTALFTGVINPSAALRNAAVMPDAVGMWEAGINLALGTDNVTNNNSYDMFKEMQLLGKLMATRERRPTPLPTREILRMATINGAKALGWENEIGSLEPGKKADLITLDLNEIGWAPAAAQDVYTALVYAISGMHVQDVMVDGRWLYQNNEWKTIDYAQVVSELNKAYLELEKRI